MKKIIVLALVAVASITASAQMVRSTTEEKWFTPTEQPKPVVKSWNHSGCFVNTGIGGSFNSHDFDHLSGFGWELGWGYRWHIGYGVSWEVFKLGINVVNFDFSDALTASITTGIRYDSPRIAALGNRSIYGNFNIGYGILSDEDSDGGCAYEVGVGFKLTRKLSLGLVYQSYNCDYRIEKYGYGWSWHRDVTLNHGMFGVKVEWQFR